MCAAIVIDVKLLNDPEISSVWAVVSSITVTTPVPCEVVGGISFAPDNGAPNLSVAACDAGDNIRTTLLKLIAKAKTRDFMATLLLKTSALLQTPNPRL
jgi:hypothetical protein